MAGQLTKNVRRLGRGKGNHGIGGEDRPDHSSVGLIGRPAGGQVNCKNWRLASLQPLQRRQFQTLQWRLEPGTQHGVHKQVGFKSAFVPDQLLRQVYDVDDSVRRVG